jgi:hypothetical protein
MKLQSKLNIHLFSICFDEKVKDYIRGIFAGGESSGSKASAEI